MHDMASQAGLAAGDHFEEVVKVGEEWSQREDVSCADSYKTHRWTQPIG